MKTSCCRWFKRLVLLTLVTGVLVVCLAPDWALPPLARFLDVSQTPAPVDYVMVLNGDPEGRPFAAVAPAWSFTSWRERMPAVFRSSASPAMVWMRAPGGGRRTAVPST